MLSHPSRPSTPIPPALFPPFEWPTLATHPPPFKRRSGGFQPDLYPDIISRVLDLCDRPTLLTARRVSRALCRPATLRLADHIVLHAGSGDTWATVKMSDARGRSLLAPPGEGTLEFLADALSHTQVLDVRGPELVGLRWGSSLQTALGTVRTLRYTKDCSAATPYTVNVHAVSVVVFASPTDEFNLHVRHGTSRLVINMPGLATTAAKTPAIAFVTPTSLRDVVIISDERRGRVTPKPDALQHSLSYAIYVLAQQPHMHVWVVLRFRCSSTALTALKQHVLVPLADRGAKVVAELGQRIHFMLENTYAAMVGDDQFRIETKL